MQYRAEIDGIRAIAVVMVLGYHAGLPGFGGGFIGVDVFFVLSGYLIAGLLEAEVARNGRIDLMRFLARRIRRLLPLMLLVGAATAVTGWFILLPPQFKDFGQSLVLSNLFSANILFWHEAGYFATHATAKPLLHMWSLGVEGQFYLMMGVIACLWARWGTALSRGLILLAVASFALSLAGAYHWPGAAFYLMPFRFWEFALGAAIALRLMPQGLGWFGVLGCALLGAGMWLIDGAAPYPGWAALLPVLGTAALLLAGGGVQRGLRLVPLQHLGTLSYGVYLWHFPVFVLGKMALPEVPTPALIPPVLALAWASYHLVEEPFRQRKSWGRAWQPLPVGVLATGALGLGLHITGGMPGRLPPAALVPLEYHEAWAMPCHDVLAVDAVKNGQSCRIGADGVAPTIALMGDSHAGQLTPALSPMLETEGLSALVYSRGWCAPVPAFGTQAPTRGPECAAFMSAAWAQVLDNPALTQVVLSAQWANFTAGSREGLAPVTYGNARRSLDNPAAFDAAMRELAARLRGQGRRLILVEPVPEFPVSVPEAIMRSAWLEEKRLTVAEPVPFVERNADALATLAQFQVQTKAEVVRPRELFCDPALELCKVADARGVPLYRDRGHLSTAGASFVAEALAQALAQGDGAELATEEHGQR